jgi:hypothetical protein
MQHITISINKVRKDKPKSRRDDFVRQACAFLYGSSVTAKQKTNLYYGIGTVDPGILPRLIRDAQDKAAYMWRERKIKTSARAHFWVLLRKERALAPKKPKKLKQLSLL